MPEDILVIDNDQGAADVIKQALESDGHTVIKAATAAMGVTFAKRARPSLVFVNLSIPGANGLEICKKIHDILPEAPIFILSQTEGKFHPSYKKLYGIEGYLKKPLSIEEISSRTSSFLVKEAETPLEDAVEIEPSEEAPSGHEMPWAEEEFHPAGPEEEEAGVIAEEEEEFHPAAAVEESFSPADENDEFHPAGPEEDDFRCEEPEETKPAFEEDLFGDRTQGGQSVKPFADYGGSSKSGSIKKILIPAAIAVVVLVSAALSYFFFVSNEEPAPPGQIAKPEVAEPVEVKVETPPVEAKPTPVVESVKPPAPPKKTAAKAKTAKKPSKTFSVQLGSFCEKANAVRFAELLRGKGYNIYIKDGYSDGAPMYRVLYGKYSSKSEASRHAGIITAKEGLETVVHSEWGI